MEKKEIKDFKSAYIYALRLLSRADYTSKMIEDKLTSRGLPEGIAKEVTDKLISEGFINNTDYGIKFIENSLNLKSKGKRYIEFELSKRGFQKEEISELLEENYTSKAKEALNKILKKTGKTVNELDFKELNSIKGKLVRQGFTFDEISGLFREEETFE